MKNIRPDHQPPVLEVCEENFAPQLIQNISKYCAACWRNARLHADTWSDATQEVFLRLLQTVPHHQWALLLVQQTPENKEFLRAIDAMKKRVQRRKMHAPLQEEPFAKNDVSVHADTVNHVFTIAAIVCSVRQLAILRLTAEGASVPQIAQELQTNSEKISDEKYKAICKLRDALCAQAN